MSYLVSKDFDVLDLLHLLHPTSHLQNPSTFHTIMCSHVSAHSPPAPSPHRRRLLLYQKICNILLDTEIDWQAYMDEVEGVINGTYDYSQLKGDTGPLVYPAGFVYIFMGFYYATAHGKDIFLAQHMFIVVYLLTLFTAASLYCRTRVQPWIMALLSVTYRIHSIFVLRLFNDPFAMLLVYAAVHAYISRRHIFGTVLFSVALSVKMNILLFAPGLAVVLVMNTGWPKSMALGVLTVAIQAVLGGPFLLSHPQEYLNGAFELGRQFKYVWTVNWRLLPESIFLDRSFQLALLGGQLLTLVAFAHFKWLQPYGGFTALFSRASLSGPTASFSAREIVAILFASNFIGMTFARSLHYQFYVWYFHTLAWLLWQGQEEEGGGEKAGSSAGGVISRGFSIFASASTLLRLALLVGVEVAWNVFPATAFSSGLLHVCHLVVLVILWRTPTLRGGAEAKKAR